MSNDMALILLMSGVLCAGYAVASLFFLRFWRQSNDRLFLFFATAFALLTVQRLALAWAVHGGRETFWMYVMRLAAFLLILAGIVDKNRRE
jgi:hypothetical protein